MLLTLDVDNTLMEAVEARAAVRGQSTAAYAEAALRARLASEEREARINDTLLRIQQAGSSFGRDGMSWKELSHEGHKY